MNTLDFIKNYFFETAGISNKLDIQAVAKTIQILLETKKQKGRIFLVGVGGGAATGSHMANDFNKIAAISAVCLSDNAGVLTALANDEGWQSIFVRQLEMHQLKSNDCIFICSVGGGNENVSKNIVLAIDYAKKVGAKIVGIVGSENGATAKMADACIIVPLLNPDRKTAHTEDFQMVIGHIIANAIFQIDKGNIKKS